VRQSSAWEWSVKMTQREDAKIAVMEQKFLLSPWAVWTHSADTFSSVLVSWMRTASFASPAIKSKFSHLLSISWNSFQMGNERTEQYWNVMPTALQTPLAAKHMYELLFPSHSMFTVVIPTWFFRSYYFCNLQSCQEVLL